MEVAWKVCAAVVTFWLNRSMILHYVLHRFRVGRGTRTAKLEEKLAQVGRACTQAAVTGVFECL